MDKVYVIRISWTTQDTQESYVKYAYKNKEDAVKKFTELVEEQLEEDKANGYYDKFEITDTEYIAYHDGEFFLQHDFIELLEVDLR